MPAQSRGQDVSINVTIEDGATVSNAANIGIRKLLGFIVGTWASAAITFQVSVDGTAFWDLYDVTGAEVTIPAGTHNKAYAAPLELLAFPYIKVRSGTSASAVAQSGGDTVILVLE